MAGYHFGRSEVVNRIMSAKNITARHWLVGGRLLQVKQGVRQCMWRPKAYWRTADSSLEQAESISQIGNHCALQSGEKSSSPLKAMMLMMLMTPMNLGKA